MNFNPRHWPELAPVVLRLSIAVVFLWFGFSQIQNPASWTRLLPSFLSVVPLEPVTIIIVNGIFEILLATLLLLGLFTRPVALLLTLHLLHITFLLGYGATAARDVALALAVFSIFLRGADDFSLDHVWRKK